MTKINPSKVIEDIIGRGVDWFDVTKLDKGSWRNYFNDAQFVSKSEVFNNELNHYLADLIKLCATMDGMPISTDKLIMLTNVQFGIVVLETFKQRLADIEDPTIETSNENPHDAI